MRVIRLAGCNTRLRERVGGMGMEWGGGAAVEGVAVLLQSLFWLPHEVCQTSGNCERSHVTNVQHGYFRYGHLVMFQQSEQSPPPPKENTQNAAKTPTLRRHSCVIRRRRALSDTNLIKQNQTSYPSTLHFPLTSSLGSSVPSPVPAECRWAAHREEDR